MEPGVLLAPPFSTVINVILTIYAQYAVRISFSSQVDQLDAAQLALLGVSQSPYVFSVLQI